MARELRRVNRGNTFPIYDYTFEASPGEDRELPVQQECSSSGSLDGRQQDFLEFARLDMGRAFYREASARAAILIAGTFMVTGSIEIAMLVTSVIVYLGVIPSCAIA